MNSSRCEKMERRWKRLIFVFVYALCSPFIWYLTNIFVFHNLFMLYEALVPPDRNITFFMYSGWWSILLTVLLDIILYKVIK